MAWGAAWLYRATGDRAYLEAAVRYWAKKDWDITTDWDNSGAAVAVMLGNLAEGGTEVPQAAEIKSFVAGFIKAWVQSNGARRRRGGAAAGGRPPPAPPPLLRVGAIAAAGGGMADTPLKRLVQAAARS
jgi:hypothetical protein